MIETTSYKVRNKKFITFTFKQPLPDILNNFLVFHHINGHHSRNL